MTSRPSARPGDLVIVDNFAVGHRAAPEAHMPATQQGLRILHRTTVKGDGEGGQVIFSRPCIFHWRFSAQNKQMGMRMTSPRAAR
jgi:hypothetical protein